MPTYLNNIQHVSLKMVTMKERIEKLLKFVISSTIAFQFLEDYRVIFYICPEWIW